MKAWIEAVISDEIRRFSVTRAPATTWRAPLVAIADAQDAIFLKLKQVVRPTHALPTDLLPSARSVVAFFLPFDDAVPRSNRTGPHASEVWARAYVETNALIGAVSTRLASALSTKGCESAQTPATHNFDQKSLMSDWSHKHVAYIAGLGTFGLHHMLITSQGCAGRLGTLVTDAELKPTPRPTHQACLYRHDGTCGACIDRCVAGALGWTPDTFDRQACYDVCLGNGERFGALGLADVCGKCACGLPCTAKDPVADRL